MNQTCFRECSICRWILTTGLHGKTMGLWPEHVSFTVEFTSSCHWMSRGHKEMAMLGGCRLFEEQVLHEPSFTPETSASFGEYYHTSHFAHMTFICWPCLVKAWVLRPAMSVSGRNIEQTGNLSSFVCTAKQHHAGHSKPKLLFSGILFLHILISGLKISIPLWTCPEVSLVFLHWTLKSHHPIWQLSNHPCHPGRLLVCW